MTASRDVVVSSQDGRIEIRKDRVQLGYLRIRKLIYD
jgi:hypothetical protein